MRNIVKQIFNYRVRALIRKEFAQIRRDRRLAFSLILPPTLQLLLLSFALIATVSNVKLGARDVSRQGQAQLHPAYLYNPGLKDSWFIVTGVFGLLLILNSSLVASGAMVREREAGTIEQLVMSPAGTAEIIIAKIAPLFLL